MRGCGGITALGQVKQPMKLVQISPRRVPGAVPASGSVQSKPNIDTVLPGGTAALDGEAATTGAGDVAGEMAGGAARCSMKAPCNAAMRTWFCCWTIGVST